ncbi:MAG: EutN/CcmL family microcompartment protein, partial [bacterium]|nr:EutN/CcmL family microcompartment protein [bacterium]
KFLLVAKTDAKLEPTGEQLVAVDTVGAGPNELVVVATGSSSRQTPNTEGKPVDSLITGIIDYVEVDGELLYDKTES